MSNNVFFSPNKPTNIYSQKPLRISSKPDSTNVFTELRKPFNEFSEKPPPFSEVKKHLISESSQKIVNKPPIRQSSSQNPKKMPEIKHLQSANVRHLEPINDNRFNYSSSKTPLRLNPFNSSSYKKSMSPEAERTIIDGLLSNQAHHINKIKQLERVQDLRFRVFEESVLNSAKAKDEQLNLLIEKRISEKLRKDEKAENAKNLKIEQQKKELKSFIEEQIGVKSPESNKNVRIPANKNTESWQNVKMIEEIRKKESKSPVKVIENQDLERNALKFFGVDSEEQELPGTSTMKYDMDAKGSPARYGKTSVRNTTYDPITDSVNTYQSVRKNPRGLGAKKVDDIPDKINSVSPPKNNDYYLSRNKAFEISNPLTGEVKVMQNMRTNERDSNYQFYIK